METSLFILIVVEKHFLILLYVCHWTFERQGHTCNHALRELYDDISTTINHSCYMATLGYLLRVFLTMCMLHDLNSALLKLSYGFSCL
jgi:hypothetical protein